MEIRFTSTKMVGCQEPQKSKAEFQQPIVRFKNQFMYNDNLLPKDPVLVDDGNMDVLSFPNLLQLQSSFNPVSEGVRKYSQIKMDKVNDQV